MKKTVLFGMSPKVNPIEYVCNLPAGMTIEQIKTISEKNLAFFSVPMKSEIMKVGTGIVAVKGEGKLGPKKIKYEWYAKIDGNLIKMKFVINLDIKNVLDLPEPRDSPVEKDDCAIFLRFWDSVLQDFGLEGRIDIGKPRKWSAIPLSITPDVTESAKKDTNLTQPPTSPVSKGNKKDLVELAEELVKKDNSFKKQLENVIQNKQLKETLTLVSQKAYSIQSQMQFSDLETMELALQIFIFMFKGIDFPPELKEKMTSTIKEKLMSSVQVSAESPSKMPSMGKNWKEIAQNLNDSDPNFKQQLIKAITDRNLQNTLNLLVNEAKLAQSDKGYSEEEIASIANELFLIVFTEIQLESETKEKMARSIANKIKEIFKISEFAPNRGTTSQAPQKVFSSKILTGDGSSNEAISNVSSQVSPLATDEDAELRRQREEIRKSRQVQQDSTSLEKATGSKGTPAPVEFNAINMLDQWIRSDGKLMKIVEKIERVAENIIRIIFDPETEGYLAYVDIQFTVNQYGNYNIIRLMCSSQTQKKYPLNIAIGDNGKKFVAANIDSNVLFKDADVIEYLKQVDFKNQMAWDPLMVLLNNDKELISKIKKLQLDNPASGAKEYLAVPVYVKNDIPTAKIFVQTFLSLTLKPSMIFLEIMEKLAEDVDQIGGGGEDYAVSSLGSTLNKSTVTQKDMRGHQFHFLSEKDQAVAIKTCPYCGRPYPNPDADYRRCPNCLAKLK